MCVIHVLGFSGPVSLSAPSSRHSHDNIMVYSLTLRIVFTSIIHQSLFMIIDDYQWCRYCRHLRYCWYLWYCRNIVHSNRQYRNHWKYRNHRQYDFIKRNQHSSEKNGSIDMVLVNKWASSRSKIAFSMGFHAYKMCCRFYWYLPMI